MGNKVAVAGNAGLRVRSDCEITLSLKDRGGISIDLNSRVKALYGSSIKQHCTEVLNFFGIKNADLRINDSGALPFVISARLEAAVKKLTDHDEEFLHEILPVNLSETTRERFRFTRLYLPGNTPGLMINAGLHSPDGIILDLEDSVAPDRKDEARYLVRNALRSLNFYGAERMVRINQGKRGLEDLDYVIPHHVNVILIPKCDTPDEVKRIDSRISGIRKKHRIKNQVYLMPVIESALGVENAFSIAGSADSVIAMAIGLEDYTADLGVQRTTEGTESFFARSRIVNACKAAGSQPIDSVFSDVSDIDGLKKAASVSKTMGFEGMGCIHPRQIAVIKEGFYPAQKEIEKAMEIANAYKDAREKGLGVVALGSKMIDPPVVNRALRTIELAKRLSIVP
jgi:citrate lyase subunit beta/citryl-CoA lyase